MKSFIEFFAKGPGVAMVLFSCLFLSVPVIFYMKYQASLECVFQSGDQIQLSTGALARVHSATANGVMGYIDPEQCRYRVSHFDKIGVKHWITAYPGEYASTP